MILKLEMITKEREKHMEKLWKEFQKVLSQYLRNTVAYRTEYSNLRDRDSDDTQNIQDHYHHVAHLSDLINGLKTKLQGMKEEHDFNLKQLVRSKAAVKTRLANLKTEMELGLRADKEMLTQLAVVSNDAIKHLQAMLKKGKSVLNLAAFCQKYETENETLLPLVHSSTKKQMFEFDEDEMQDLVRKKEFWGNILNQNRTQEISEFVTFLKNFRWPI